MTEVWAHRGDRSRFPENTLLAFRGAIEAGADGIELDVHRTVDGELAIRHDPTVTMPDGSQAAIRDLTWAQLRSMDVGDAVHGPQRIPSLEEVFVLLAATGLRLNVELKNLEVSYPGMEEQVLAAGAESGMAQRIIYSSFNHSSLATLVALAPGVEVAPLYEDGLHEAWDYAARLGARSVHPHLPLVLVPGIIGSFTAAGIAVRPWTVNNVEDIEALMAMGVDAIMTDRPALAVSLREKRSAR